jgi:hypothetical protein
MAKKAVGTLHFDLSNQQPSEGADQRAEGRLGLCQADRGQVLISD